MGKAISSLASRHSNLTQPGGNYGLGDKHRGNPQMRRRRRKFLDDSGS
jgi:hypothetical protein